MENLIIFLKTFCSNFLEALKAVPFFIPRIIWEAKGMAINHLWGVLQIGKKKTIGGTAEKKMNIGCLKKKIPTERARKKNNVTCWGGLRGLHFSTRRERLG